MREKSQEKNQVRQDSEDLQIKRQKKDIGICDMQGNYKEEEIR